MREEKNHQNANDTDDFDDFGVNYREIHNQNIKISGADSDYFSEYKVKIVFGIESEDSNNRLRILDLGCGDGNSIKFFRGYFPNSKIYGADVSYNSIEIAQSKNISDVQLDVFDGKHIPYESNYFDIVFLAGVIHHVPVDDRRALLSEVYRVLGNKGRLYIFEHNPYNPLTRQIVRDCIFDENAMLISAHHLYSILLSIGFRKIGTRYTIFAPRHKLFQPFLGFEKYIFWLPLGGQYFIISTK